jgi:hypothetical protein
MKRTWKRKEAREVVQNQQHMTVDPAGERIAALLTEQRDLYRQLARLADQQRGLITGDAPERLLGVLAERQRLIDRLTATGCELKPHQLNWRQIREHLPAPLAHEIDGLVAEVNTLLSDILKKDEADTALLSARKNETARAMGTLQVSRRAGSAYAAASGYGSGQSSGMDWTQA